jgi:tRNA(Arg) A34 adenosine deaminase TadA
VSHWQELPGVWRQAFEQAATAYLKESSAPIGALVVDADGTIVSNGRNAMATGRLAHAEMNALDRIPQDADRSRLCLYSTLEPCPMCAGAIRMCQLRELRIGAMDPSAGSSELLHATDFMRAFPCSVHAPTIPLLESVIVALVVEYRVRNQHSRWRERWTAYRPASATVGDQLARSGSYEGWVRAGISAEVLYDQVSTRLAA